MRPKEMTCDAHGEHDADLDDCVERLISEAAIRRMRPPGESHASARPAEGD